ncbi:MAG TPA: hypothetical protein VKA61_09585 [Sphingomicrobium sp.]|nr:hypothetical protein [Sphingomicrobium sp.]
MSESRTERWTPDCLQLRLGFSHELKGQLIQLKQRAQTRVLRSDVRLRLDLLGSQESALAMRVRLHQPHPLARMA